MKRISIDPNWSRDEFIHVLNDAGWEVIEQFNLDVGHDAIGMDAPIRIGLHPQCRMRMEAISRFNPVQAADQPILQYNFRNDYSLHYSEEEVTVEVAAPHLIHHHELILKVGGNVHHLTTVPVFIGSGLGKVEVGSATIRDRPNGFGIKMVTTRSVEGLWVRVFLQNMNPSTTPDRDQKKFLHSVVLHVEDSPDIHLMTAEDVESIYSN